MSRKGRGQLPPALKIAASSGARRDARRRRRRVGRRASSVTSPIDGVGAPRRGPQVGERRLDLLGRASHHRRRESLRARSAARSRRRDRVRADAQNHRRSMLPSRSPLVARRARATLEAPDVEPLAGVLVDDERPHLVPVSWSTSTTGAPRSSQSQSLPQRNIAARTSQNARPLSVKPILVAHRALGIGLLHHQAFLDEARQTLARAPRAARRAALEVLEPPLAGEGLAQDEGRPPVADQVGRAGDGTGPAVETRAPHARSLDRSARPSAHGAGGRAEAALRAPSARPSEASRSGAPANVARAPSERV